MKTTLLAILILFATTSNATNYYFSSLSGDDARTTDQAKNPATPWKTITKLNSFFATLLPGDSVLFKRGETFYGSIIVKKSGTALLPIVISAYGNGARPVITGMQTLTNWVSVGGGKYESLNPALGTQVNMVTFKGIAQEKGRYPNSDAANGGYLNFETHSGTTSITDNQLTSSTVWTGAELVVRISRYIIDRTKISTHSGTKISYSPALTYAPLDGFGYFIQNDLRTLDQLGEWFYNPSTKKMTVYFGTASPATNVVKASAIANVVYIYDFDNIVMDNLSVEGGDSYSVYLYSTANINIKNCDISFGGIDGIIANNTTNLRLENSNILSNNNIGINLSNSTDGIVRNNKVKKSGMLLGMGQNAANKSVGIRETGKNNLVEYNEVDSSGYIGIRFGGDYAIIKNNLVSGFNLTKDDGAGIYTTDPVVGRKILGNIVLNGIGAAAGTTSSVAGSTSGIYLDDDAGSVEVSNNTVANCNKAGILLHNAHEITMTKNTIYNNAAQQLLMSHNMAEATSPPIRNVILKNNVLFAKTGDQGVINIMTVNNDVSLEAGTMDSNYYCRPIDDNFIIKTSAINAAGTSVYQDCDLQAWKAFYKKDMASKKTAVQIMPHRVNTLIGANKFSNGTFNSTISGVNVGTTGTSYTKTWASNSIDGGTFQVVTASTKPGMTTATIPIAAVSKAKKYIIGFSVKNSKDTLIYVYARQSGSPYKVLSNNGVKTILRMNSTRQDYELAFTPTADEPSTSIFFETPSQSTTWWLDNIRIYEADVTPANVDDSIRFEYNASQTPKTIALAGNYTDPKGAVYQNSIVLQPYTSAILIKQNTGALASVNNIAPTINISIPVTNSSFAPSSAITINATANDSDGSVSKVEFYNGNTLIGSDSTSPYSYTWTNVAAGNYIITAKATDNSARVSTSSAVNVSVATPNAAPSVSITSPAASAAFTAPASITINATAADTDGSVSKVEYYNGSTLLHTEGTAPYSWIWANVPAGNYSISVKAIDNLSKATTSAPVTVSVSNPNAAPLVSIAIPAANATFTAPASITITAAATDTDGLVTNVSFYNADTLIGATNATPYSFTWNNVVAGNYTIKAKAIDNNSLISVSAPVTIVVKDSSLAPPPAAAYRPVLPVMGIAGQGNSIAATHRKSANALSVRIEPNPAYSVISVTLSGTEGDGELKLNVLSMSGNSLVKKTFKSSKNTVKLNVESLTPGTYVLQVISGEDVINKIFIKI